VGGFGFCLALRLKLFRARSTGSHLFPSCTFFLFAEGCPRRKNGSFFGLFLLFPVSSFAAAFLPPYEPPASLPPVLFFVGGLDCRNFSWKNSDFDHEGRDGGLLIPGSSFSPSLPASSFF